jgi:hypothetical protein
MSIDRFHGEDRMWVQQRIQHTAAQKPRADSVSPSTAATHTGQNAADQKTADADFGFWDLLDVVNPLQHIPVVSSVYREITGDEIKAASRVVGGTLYGGPIGFVSATANVMVEAETGKDVGGNVLAMLSGEAKPPAGGVPADPAPRAYAAATPSPAAAPAAAAKNALPASAAAPMAAPAHPIAEGVGNGIMDDMFASNAATVSPKSAATALRAHSTNSSPLEDMMAADQQTEQDVARLMQTPNAQANGGQPTSLYPPVEDLRRAIEAQENAPNTGSLADVLPDDEAVAPPPPIRTATQPLPAQQNPAIAVPSKNGNDALAFAIERMNKALNQYQKTAPAAATPPRNKL